MQGWNVGGRRTQLGFGSWSAAFQYRADGLMSAVNDATFGYNDSGLLRGRTNAFRSVTVDQRDGVGRVKQATTRAGVSTAMVESWQWTGDGLPSLYTAVRSDFTDMRRFTYGPMHRRLLSETLNVSGSQSITNVYEFDQGQAGGLGVMTLGNQSGAFAGNWNVASTNQDAFKRVTGERSTTLNRVARGFVNGPATLSGNINSRPLDLRYNPATGGEWSAQIDMAAGQNTLTVYAAHPSGQFTTNKASTFTVASTATDAVETKFDSGGYVTNRVWKDSQGTVLRTQNLTWDAFGRLVKQTERDSGNNGYDWQTQFDGFGRRARTVTTPVTNSVALSAQQRTLNHFYDPQVEFMEAGISINGNTTWKTYGPDVDGMYGGQQGLGGLELLTTGSSTVGVVQDGFGNVLGSAKDGSVTWNSARVGLYGPAEGYPGLSVSSGALSTEHLAYRGKWRDEAGFYYWGARPYEAERRAFLSFDTMGHDATPDGYAAFAGRPTGIWDADGRLATQVAQETGRYVMGAGGFLADTVLNTVYGGGMAMNWTAGAVVELTGGNGDPFYSQANQWQSYMSPYEHMGNYDSQSPAAQMATAATIVLSPESLAGRFGAAERVIAAKTVVPNGSAYSVAFETTLNPASYPGLSRAAHFQEANGALLRAMEGDAQFAQIMQQGGVNLQRTATGLAPRTSPAGWTWHHAPEPGVMQLVPRTQHAPGSIFQNTIHPGGQGGYSIWGQ
jgi:RHS repeat-associated protein